MMNYKKEEKEILFDRCLGLECLEPDYTELVRLPKLKIIEFKVMIVILEIIDCLHT